MNRLSLLLLAALLAAPGCSWFRQMGFAPNEPDPAAVRRPPEREEPAHVVVQQVLIAFEGTDVKAATRTREEAKRLAERVLEMARSGRDFGDLVRLYSDDRPGDGTYAIANWGVPLASPDEKERRNLVRGFANAAFALDPGAIALVPYDPASSPLGWHVVKRLR